jgi:hypothetical protein
MTSSPDLIHELRASRPAAPAELRARVRDIASTKEAPAPWARWRFPVRRSVLVAVPAAAALALASAGALGLARSDGPQAVSRDAVEKSTLEAAAPSTVPGAVAPTQDSGSGGSAAGERARQVSATLTVEVKDGDAVSRAAQDALDLTRSLGGYVVSSTVATGEEGSAAITVRVPVDKVQDAIAGLSGLGRIVSQQVNVQDLQAGLDAMERTRRSLVGQIVRITARLDSEELDATTRATLEARRRALRSELRDVRQAIAATQAEADMSTIQLTVVTPGAFGAVTPPSRIDRAIDEALNVLAWEGVVMLGLAIVLAPFALVGFAAWLGRRLYRRHEEDRLLAA